MNAQSQNFLDQYHWKNRIILLSGDSQNVEDQLSILQESNDGLSDRDLKIFHIDDEVMEWPENKRYSYKAETLKEKYDVENETFTFILIGKDGTEKLRSNEPVSLEKLFSVIDAMPMRQREMDNKN